MWNPYVFVPSERFVMEFRMVTRITKRSDDKAIGHKRSIFSGIKSVIIIEKSSLLLHYSSDEGNSSDEVIE
jgi:hypothetical protein